MRLIAITTEYFFDREPEAVNLLFGDGMEVLHIRKPCAPYAGMIRFIGQIDRAFHSRIVLHDHYELASTFALKGIHVNRRNNPGNPGFYGKQGLSVSCSCHSFEEVAAVCPGHSSKEGRAVVPAVFDYAFLSPVFDSISKAGYKQGFTPEQLSDAGNRGIINDRVIALGGIMAGRIPAVRSYGFGGVAVLGALWGTLAADGNMNALQARFNELKNGCRMLA
ncbi:MAG: thiamine phosphate synthase [Tannerella sp.]|jgi:thiamine-phosphate pyrophosphorylase|nr:thiamine phosphate synthase [Tannerella sp.]